MINKLNLNPKQKIYFTAALWLGILILVSFFVVSPLISQIKNDGAELAQKKQDMESFYSEWQLLETAQKDYLKMQGEINGLPAFLKPSEALKFIVLIEKFAQYTNNAQTVSVVSQQDKVSQKKETTDFQINLRGKFPGLVNFLVYLENAPYYNNLKTFGIQRLTEKEGQEKTFSTGDINTILTVSVINE